MARASPEPVRYRGVGPELATLLKEQDKYARYLASARPSSSGGASSAPRGSGLAVRLERNAVQWSRVSTISQPYVLSAS